MFKFFPPSPIEKPGALYLPAYSAGTVSILHLNPGDSMKSAMQALKVFFNDESGQSLIEYALVAGIIGLGAVVAMTSLSTQIKTAFNTISSSLANAI
jgi:pilus assembly protein Flp/PilA